MKRLFVFVLTTVFAINVNAQDTPKLDSIMVSNMKAEKRILIKNVVDLTEKEALEFWPLYDEYTEKKFAISKGLNDLVMDNIDKLDNLTNDEAEDIWEKKIDFDKKNNKLERKYFKKMLRVLPAGKVVRYFQAESKIKSMINAEMAIEVPLINQK